MTNKISSQQNDMNKGKVMMLLGVIYSIITFFECVCKGIAILQNKHEILLFLFGCVLCYTYISIQLCFASIFFTHKKKRKKL